MTDRRPTEPLDPNRLFDTLLQMLDLENDEALASRLHVEPYLIKRVREGLHPLDPSLLIRINEATDINMRHLRRMMGDRRNEYRLDAAPRPAAPVVREVVDKHDEGEEREKLRRSFERDDTGLPNFVQWS